MGDRQLPDGQGPIRWAMAAIAALAAATLAWTLYGLFSGDPPPSVQTPEPGGDASASREHPSLPADDATPDLTGRVIDSAGTPIAGVHVSATAEAERQPGAPPPADAGVGLVLDAAREAVSDGEGRFAIAGLAPGHVRLRLEGPGVITAEVRFVEVPQKGLDLVASREVAIEGRVSGDGELGGVTVTALGELGPETVETGAAGRFRIAGLAEGVYRVWAAKDHRASLAARVERRGESSGEAVVLTLEPAVIVGGRLVDAESGAPLAGRVSLTHAGDEPPRAAEAGADGRFVIDGVPPGRWFAEADAPGYIPAEQLAFEADRDRQLTVRLTRGGAIAGVVLDPDGQPVAGALVEPVGGPPAPGRRAAAVASSAPTPGGRFIPRGELGVLLGPIPYPPPVGTARALVAQPVANPDGSAAGNPEASQRLTGADGGFRLAGLRPGRYRAVASHIDYAGGSSREIELALGREVSGVEVRLARGVIVRGTVRDRRGDPIAGATLSTRADGGVIRAVTGPEGAYQLPPLAAGGQSLTVDAAAPGYATARKTRGRAADGEEVVLDFTLEAADKKIAGRVLDPGGFPLEGAQIVSESGAGAVSDAGGHFVVSGLAAGSHQLTVTYPGFPPHRRAAQAGDRVEIAVPAGGGVAGRVIDRDTRAPVAGAVVEVRRGKGEAVRASVVDGRYELAPLEVGRYRISARAPGYAANAIERQVPAGRRAGAVTVKDGDIELVRGATVSGTVRDGDGVRVAGARVAAGGVATTSDIDGHFRLEDVAAGPVVLEASKGEAAGQLLLTLAPGEELTTAEVRIQ